MSIASSFNRDVPLCMNALGMASTGVQLDRDRCFLKVSERAYTSLNIAEPRRPAICLRLNTVDGQRREK